MPTQQKKEQVKFKTNVPEIITFQFDDYKTGEGQYGTWYAYGVENRGQDKMLFPTEILHNKLQAIGNLKDRTLEIEKCEGDNNRKYWVIRENGEEIALNAKNAPQTSQKPEPTPNTQTNQTTQGGGNSDAIRAWAVKVSEEIASLKKRLDEVDSKDAELEKALGFAILDLDGLKGALLNEENMKAFKFHKGVTKPFREAQDKAQSTINEEGIEIRTDLEELERDNNLDR